MFGTCRADGECVLKMTLIPDEGREIGRNGFGGDAIAMVCLYIDVGSGYGGQV
jgi:hypothetical protein